MVQERRQPQQLIQVGDRQIPLPEGVTVSDWALEKVRAQNPRIRGLLGCIRLLEGVLESNYALLHCSPERLFDIWGKVREVSRLLRQDVAPLLALPSKIPRLERARRGAEVSLAILSDQVLDAVDRFPPEVPAERHLELRKLLCVSIGQLHAFLQDAFGELVASDPRSLHDADYFLSRRFPRDIEEAEWLLATVLRLRDYLAGLAADRPGRLAELARHLERDQEIPEGEEWDRTEEFFRNLIQGLTPKLNEVLALTGIRFEEMEILDRYAVEIPTHCRIFLSLRATGREVRTEIEAAVENPEQAARAVAGCQAVFSRRMAKIARAVDGRFQDLIAFIPLWLSSIEKRRALMFRKEGPGDPS